MKWFAQFDPLFKRTLFTDTLIFLSILFLAFLPVFFHSFAYHNDLGFWMYGQPGKDHSTFWETGHLVMIFRPLGAIFLNLHAYALRNFTGIETLAYSRVVAVVAIALIALLIDGFLLKKTKLDRFQRVSLLLLIFVQPSWLLATMWVSNLSPGILSYLASVLAGLLFYSAVSSQEFTRRNKTVLFLVSALFLGASFLTYPPGALAFFWILFLDYAFIETASLQCKKAAAWAVFFGGVCAVSLLNHASWMEYVLCHNRFIKCSTWDAGSENQYALTLVHDLSTKVEVLSKHLQMLGGSWFTHLGGIHPFYILVSFLLLVGVFWRSSSHEPKLNRFLKTLFLTLVSVLILNIPNLVAKGQVTAFRVMAPMTVIMGIGLVRFSSYFTGLRSRVLLTAFVLVCVVSSMVTAQKYAKYYEDGWNKVLSIPSLPELCKDRKSLMDFERAFRSLDGGGWTYMVERKDMYTHSFDFGDYVFVSWVLSGTCKLLDEPGSTFENSAPGP